MADINGEHKIEGSDIVLSIKQEYIPIPVIQDPSNPWLPKTDWSRDGIIATEHD